MKHSLLLLFILTFSSILHAQSKGGLKISLLTHASTVNGFDTSNYITTSKKSYGFYPALNVGFLFQLAISKNLFLEPQLLASLNGQRYIGTDARTNITTKGSINNIAVEIPLNILVKFLFKKSSGNIQLGGGPFYRHNVYGLQKEKNTNIAYKKEEIKFNNTNGFTLSELGLNAFVGLEDADDNCLRIGISYGNDGLYKSNEATVKMITGSITYILLF
jgi:hypothetical protein